MRYKIDVTGKWKLWFWLSLALIIPGLISLLVQGLNWGIDFTGGMLLQLQFEDAVAVEEVRDVLVQFDLEQSPIQSSENNNIIIRTKALAEEERQELLAALKRSWAVARSCGSRMSVPLSAVN